MALQTIDQNFFKPWCNGRLNNLKIDGKFTSNTSITPIAQTGGTLSANTERAFISSELAGLGTNAQASIVFTNNLITANDTILLILYNTTSTYIGEGLPYLYVKNIASGTCTIEICNVSAVNAFANPTTLLYEFILIHN